jgi:oligogalacturonide lyase
MPSPSAFLAQHAAAAVATAALLSLAALCPARLHAEPSLLADETVGAAVMYPDLDEATESGMTPPATVMPNPPTSWIDPDTGHRVIRLTQEPGSASFYFNINSYTPDGKDMVYTTADQGLGVLNLATRQTRVLLVGPVTGGVGAAEVGRKTRTVFYMRGTGNPDFSELWSVNIDTGTSRKIAALPRRGGVFSINADETLGAGSYVVGEGKDYSHAPAKAGKKGGYALEEPVDKVQMMRTRLAAHYPMIMFTVDLATGEIKTIQHTTEWLSHLQFSTTDPNLLMYVHQGMWWLVQKQWLMHADGTHNFQFDNDRTMEMEGTGHQWWDAQGNIWYDQRLSPYVGYIAGYDPKTGERIWYHYEHNESSIHFSRSSDGKLFCGDGSQAPGAQWIYLFHPVRLKDEHSLGTHLIHSGFFRSERLVNMAKQNYRLEPNPTFTPDGKWVVFRSNMFGATYAFAVEVAKADAKTPNP